MRLRNNLKRPRDIGIRSFMRDPNHPVFWADAVIIVATIIAIFVVYNFMDTILISVYEIPSALVVGAFGFSILGLNHALADFYD